MPDVSFEEIDTIIAAFPPLDENASGQAMARQLELGATVGGDGALASWIAGCQQRYPIGLDRPRVAIFAAAHGVDPGATAAVADIMEATARAEGSLYEWCEEIDADLRIYELALSEPSAPLDPGPALSDARAANAVAYGMMAVDDATDIVAVAALNPAADIAAASLGRALLGGDAGVWGAQAPADGSVASGSTPWETLAARGGDDIAAAVGAIVAARMAGAPVLLDGLGAWAAAAVIAAIRDDGIDHCALLVPEAGPPALEAFAQHLPAARLAAPACEMRGESGARAVATLRDAVAAHTRG
jgi:nicotinate-nucleotide--dimethylbenzimidazole phosphoribosyltransferase